ncbi:MAG: hypothetical protein ACK5O7_05670 [Holosporales bacterium]
MNAVTIFSLRSWPRLTPSLIIMGASLIPWLCSGLYEALIPHVLLAALFFWAVFAPQWFPLWIMLICSCFYDISHAVSLGLTGALSSLVWGVLVLQRRFLVHRSFLTLWAVFSLVVVIYMALLALGLVLHQKPLNISWFLLQFGVTTVSFPWLMTLFNFLHRPEPA